MGFDYVLGAKLDRIIELLEAIVNKAYEKEIEKKKKEEIGGEKSG